jgi:alkylation response protein AidB-like acyl-CoA dehydrogenase
MPIALSEDHVAQRLSVRRWLDTHCPPDVPRSLLDAEVETLLPVWKGIAGQGWLGIHLPEELGGQGFGLLELAVVLEETGWSSVPGPLAPTTAAAALLVQGLEPTVAGTVVPGLVEGTSVGAVALEAGVLDASVRPDGRLEVSGTLRPVLGGQTASVVVAPFRGPDGSSAWCLLEVDGDRVRIDPLASLDPTRRVAAVVADGAVVPAVHRLVGVDDGRVRRLVTVLLSAEHVGGARWCLETATEYAKIRVQFGRPIGQFQAVKHRLADMAVRVEQMTSVAWDAVLAVGAADDADPDDAELAVATAAALCADGFVRSAQECLQILGGIGFTWEHDLHLRLKRALADRQLLGGPHRHRRRVTAVAAGGTRRDLTTDLPEEAERWRHELAPVVAGVEQASEGDRRARMVDAGLVVPHWPAPWGRDAGAVEQVVLDELLAAAGITRPHLGVGAWALPVIMTAGTPEQQARWVRPTLLGDLSWCQLFSEPGAGSDLAALSTRAERVEGGWSVTGQKVWTSMAHVADWGICLVRTDPEAPKHEGITYCIVDMASPGLDVRPLRELTGAALFNEVFFDSVFVPDGCVIGAVNGGWGMARQTLANERVSISSGATFGTGVESVLRLAARLGDGLDADTASELGGLLAEAQSLRLMGHRSTLLALAGADPGPGASLRKLLGAEHEQRVQLMGLSLLGAEGATLEGRSARWTGGVLATRCLTIAGGTSEVQRNVIAERILGLPRDPEPEG